jgi:hypothetical protein
MITVKNNFKMMAVALTALCMLSFSNASMANNGGKDKASAELKFVGKSDNLPTFRLLLSNSDVVEYQVTVKEANGEVLFSETLKGNNISRIYKLDAENPEWISGTTFEITNKATNVTTVYKISTQTKTEERMEISQL